MKRSWIWADPNWKRWGPISVLFFACAFFPLLVNAGITVYPPPPDAAGNSTFSVQIRSPGGAWADLFAYDAVVDKASRSHMSFVYFDSDFSRKVEVRVTKTSGTIGSVKIRPDSSGIVPSLSGNVVSFTMTKPKKISVEVDGDILNNLFIFANRKETGAVKGPGTGIHYFGPGTHYIGDGTGTIYLSGGEKVYIAGGAIVYGNLFVQNASNVSVSGRGILSGSLFNHALPDNMPKPSMITVDGSSRVAIKDIIILDTVGWNIPIKGADAVTLDNLKIIGWTVNSDGINPQYSRNVRINDCLIRTNDDCISVKLAFFAEDPENSMSSNNIVIQNSILWADQGRALAIGPESYSTKNPTISGITARNIDILRTNNFDADWAKGVMAISCGDGATVKNVSFQNIRVDGISDTTSLLSLAMAPTPFNTSPGGLVQNIVFNNISLSGPNQQANAIYGHDAGHMVNGVRFTNLRINGTCVGSALAGNILTNEYIKNLTFSCPSSSPAR